MSKVRKRTVLYLSGFDPRGVRYYYQLFKTEAQKQASVSGYRIEIGKRERIEDHIIRWKVSFTDDGDTVETEYLYCEWDDIVRHFWVKSPFRLIWVTLTSSWRAIRAGVFRKTFQWSWPAGMTATMPLLLITGIIFLSIGLMTLGGLLFGTIGSLIGLAATAAIFWLALLLEQKFNLTWVGRILSFHEREEQSRTGMLDERREEFAQYLKRRFETDDTDEILVAGHSYGTILAIGMVARVLKSGVQSRTTLSLATLGQTIMWLAWLPGAIAIRNDIATVAESDAVNWIDISAPPDGACFALVDPYTAIGDRQTDRQNPKLINAKFHEIMPTEKFEKRSRDWMELHFQYIMATAQQSDYDFFAITSGPQTLADRFSHRKSVRDFTRLRRGKAKALR